MQQAWAEEMMMHEAAMHNQQMHAGAMGRMMQGMPVGVMAHMMQGGVKGSHDGIKSLDTNFSESWSQHICAIKTQ